MNVPHDFGERIKRAMRVSGLSNADVARAIGVHVKTVSLWRAGETIPGAFMAGK